MRKINRHQGDSIFKRITILIFSAGMVVSACNPVSIAPISTPFVPSETNTPFQPGTKFTATVVQTKTSYPIPTETIVPYLNIPTQSLKGVRIRFWQPWSGNAAGQLESLVKEFNRSNEWGILVEVYSPGSSGELYNQLNANLDADTIPNIVASPIEHLLSWENNNKGILVDLTGYVYSSDWGLSQKDIANIPVVFWDKSPKDEKLIGFPAQRTLQVLFYNQTWAKELGFNKSPETFSEFKEQSCAAAQANLNDGTIENDGTGGWIVTNDSLSILSWMRGFGDPGLPEKDTQAYHFNNQVVNETFSALRKLYDNNCAWISKLPQPYEYFGNREALFYSGSLQDIAYQGRTQVRLEKHDEWTVIPYPSENQKPVLVLSGPSYAVLQSSYTEQMAAWLFIRWMSQADHEAKMIEVSSTLPISLTTGEKLGTYGLKYPQWKQTLTWLPIEQPAPQLASWCIVRNLMEDAAWQIFYTDLSIDQIANILVQLDDMIPEVLSHNEE